jgi:Recombination endonuclease VII
MSQTCRKCGGEKQPGRGRQYCDDCRPRRSARTQELVEKRRRERERRESAPEGMRWCGRCDNHLPAAQFGVRSDGKPVSYCIPCQSAYMHERRISKVFGITAEKYDEMLELQGGRCAICRVKPRTRRLSVDHDHATNEIRGLLCTRCNHKLLGSAREDPVVLRRAARYLDEPPAVLGHDLHLRDQDERWFAVETELTEAVKDAAARDLPFVAHRPDGYGPARIAEWPVTLTLADFTRLLRDAGYGDPP